METIKKIVKEYKWLAVPLWSDAMNSLLQISKWATCGGSLRRWGANYHCAYDLVNSTKLTANYLFKAGCKLLHLGRNASFATNITENQWNTMTKSSFVGNHLSAVDKDKTVDICSLKWRGFLKVTLRTLMLSCVKLSANSRTAAAGRRASCRTSRRSISNETWWNFHGLWSTCFKHRC